LEPEPKADVERVVKPVTGRNFLEPDMNKAASGRA
jgi:hypothetical protein